MKKTTIFALAAAMFAAACTKNDEPGAAQDEAVRFNASIAQTPATRTTGGGDTWAAGDKVGIFMIASASPDLLAENQPYTASPAGELTPDGEPMYYPQDGSTVDFTAYYPYNAAVTAETLDLTVAGQTTEAAQNALDVLWARTPGMSKGSPAVGLAFGHVLSKVTFNITLGAGLDALTGDDATEVIFSGMPALAELGLRSGFLTPTTVGDFAALKAATSSADASFTALVVPQPDGAGRTVRFAVGGDTFSWTIPDGEAFAAGEHYVYPVTINLTGITVGAATIAPWITINHGAVIPELSEVKIKGIWCAVIKPGTFQMGSSDSDTQAEPNEKPRHWVRLTKGFYMSRYEVTNAQYAAFLNANNIDGSNGFGEGNVTYDQDGSSTSGMRTLVYDCTTVGLSQWGVIWNTGKWEAMAGYENHPVIHVTWYGAKAYADWIGGALPTEAQWEYACRAGTETAYSYGDVADGDYMWYNFNNSGQIHKVGEKLPNAWGLYDMHGNVLEWCLDQWDNSDNYQMADTEATAISDPLVTTGSTRVLRGGTWVYGAAGCRSAVRASYGQHGGTDDIGFRVVFP